jgi:hypothetical protein
MGEHLIQRVPFPHSVNAQEIQTGLETRRRSKGDLRWLSTVRGGAALGGRGNMAARGR